MSGSVSMLGELFRMGRNSIFQVLWNIGNAHSQEKVKAL
jgi:hypothetical protein